MLLWDENEACGDINIDCLNGWRSLLTAYNLMLTVNFSVRIQNDLCTTFDKIFVDCITFSSSSSSTIVNGLSGHDAEYLVVK
jgi:hypothetical protein